MRPGGERIVWGGAAIERAGDVCGAADVKLDKDRLQRTQSQSSLADLEAFLDRSALRVVNGNQNLNSEKCESVEEGGVDINEDRGVMIAVGEEVRVQDQKDMKFYDCKVTAVKEGKCKVHFKGWKAQYDEWLPLDSQCLMRFTSVPSGCQRQRPSIEQLGEGGEADASQQRSGHIGSHHSTLLQPSCLGSRCQVGLREVEVQLHVSQWL